MSKYLDLDGLEHLISKLKQMNPSGSNLIAVDVEKQLPATGNLTDGNVYLLEKINSLDLTDKVLPTSKDITIVFTAGNNFSINYPSNANVQFNGSFVENQRYSLSINNNNYIIS